MSAELADSISSKPELSTMMFSFFSCDVVVRKASEATPDDVGVREELVVTEGDEEYGEVNE